mmetsp:Transcript_55601/g.97433  ORF Transcript_55601/g.97433 Transcript_55601/m.97433 type:complete len:365 (+) Transcript_55601:196-1290(+)
MQAESVGRGRIAVLAAVHDHHGVTTASQAALHGHRQRALHQRIVVSETLFHNGNDVAHIALGLTGHRGLRGHHQHRHRSAILGDQARGQTILGKYHNQRAGQLAGRLHRAAGEALGGAQRHATGERLLADKVKLSIVVDQGLGLDGGVAHHGHGLHRELTVGRLTRQHDHIGAVQDSVGDIGALSAGGARVGDHTLQHLSCGHHGLASQVALADHHLLRQKHLLDWNLHSQVPSRHHDTIRLGQNLVKVLHALLVLNLRDDLDIGAFLAQHRANKVDITALAHETRRNEVHLVGHAEVLQIGDILLSERGQVHHGAGQVHVLGAAERGVVEHAGHHGGCLNLGHLQHQSTIRHEDLAAHLYGGR